MLASMEVHMSVAKVKIFSSDGTATDDDAQEATRVTRLRNGAPIPSDNTDPTFEFYEILGPVAQRTLVPIILKDKILENIDEVQNEDLSDGRYSKCEVAFDDDLTFEFEIRVEQIVIPADPTDPTSEEEVTWDLVGVHLQGQALDNVWSLAKFRDLFSQPTE